MLRDGFCPLVWTLTECDWCLKSSERILRRLLGKVCAAKRDPKRRRLEDKVVLGKIAIAISLDPLTVEFGRGERGEGGTTTIEITLTTPLASRCHLM